MVPNGWVLAGLQSLRISTVDGDRGKNYPKKDDYLVDGYALFLGADNIENGVLNLEKKTYISKEKHDAMRTGVVQEGDILLVMRGNGTGRSCIFKNMNNAKAARINSGLVILRQNKEYSDIEYLHQLIISPIIQKQFESFMFGSAQPQLTITLLKNLRFPFPPIHEQKKIARILSAWDKAIITTEKLIINSQHQKNALMQQLLTGRKRLLDKNGKMFNSDWKEHQLSELEEIKWVVLSRGNVISKKDIEANPGPYPIYSSSVKNNGLMGRYGSYMFDEELISWSVDGGGDFFYRPKHKFSVTNVSGYMKLDPRHLDCRFIAYQLEFMHSKLKFDYQSKAHPSVIRDIYKLSIPGLDEQREIARVISTADNEITNLKQNYEYLKQEKKALMQQLLTGKRRVKIN